MAVPALPVWTIPPNWKQPIVERLEWLSDVLTSRSGAEQRRAVRLTPRRFFEFRINPLDNVRTFLDLWLHRLGDNECLLPLWHDHARLSATSASGTSRLNFDNTYREFVTDGFAILWSDPFTFEVVEISAQDDTGLDLAAPLGVTWNQRASLFPLRRAFADPEVTSRALTSRVGECTMEFGVSESNPFDGGAETLPLLNGHPILTLEPNRLEGLETQYRRIMDEIDLQIGLRKRYDEGGRAFQTQFYNWRAKGRQERYELRQLLYRLNGRQKALWLPSFNDDVKLTAALGAAQNYIHVQQIGYAYTGGAGSGREYLTMLDDTGTRRYIRVTGTGVAPGVTQERLNLSAVAGFNAAAGRTASFMDMVRLDSDELEITHYHDSDGLCEVSAPLKAFKNSRVAPAILVLPTEAADMLNYTCGDPEPDNSCAPEYYQPVFDGWYVEWRVDYGLFETPYDREPGWYVRSANWVDLFYSGAPSAYWENGGHILIWDTSPTGCYFIVRERSANSYAPQERRLRLQFNSGGVPAGTRAQVSMKRWDDPFPGYGGTLSPLANSVFWAPNTSWSTGNPFDVRGLWPDDWYFNF